MIIESEKLDITSLTCYCRGMSKIEELMCLCWSLNKLTNPGALKTDSEHERDNAKAREVRNQIHKEFTENVDFRIDEDGRYMLVQP